MAVTAYVVRGVGPGTSIPLYITGGLAIGSAVVSPTPDYRIRTIAAETRERDIDADTRTRVIVD